MKKYYLKSMRHLGWYMTVDKNGNKLLHSFTAIFRTRMPPLKIEKGCGWDCLLKDGIAYEPETYGDEPLTYNAKR
ncbi:MAG TPA: hypothetical protein ENH85_00550 [Candidatus Scalindua sp.]|nr:hypothetical protein [Candidatus Scalindua sp.]